MDKTIVVSVERLARHRLYKRVIRLSTKFKAHDEAQRGAHRRHRPHRGVAAAVGDQALAAGQVVARAGEHGCPASVVAEEAATTEAIHAAAHPGPDHDADEADEAADAADRGREEAAS